MSEPLVFASFQPVGETLIPLLSRLIGRPEAGGAWGKRVPQVVCLQRPRAVAQDELGSREGP
jgi:hypothetical protein